MSRYFVHQYDEKSLTVLERGGCINPDGTVDDRIVCDFQLYGDETIDAQSQIDADRIAELLNAADEAKV